MAITVGIAAGLINFVVVFLQLTFPLLIVFLLVALLPADNNAITWSVVARQLQASFWPLLLSADSTSLTKVRTRVLLFSAASTSGLILLAAAAVITPLGLYETVTEGVVQNVSFVYARDLSPIGQATISRDEYKPSRLCSVSSSLYYNCPGQENGFSFFRNASGSYYHRDDATAYISSVPPSNLSEIFGSGRVGNLSTVASPLDLQYRSYIQKVNVEADQIIRNITTRKWRVDEYRKRSVGRFSMFQSFILSNDYVIVDGIVADMKNGGIGFRNHTLPTSIDQGAEWTEAILWMEPETVCVDTNMTYKWTVPDPDLSYMGSQLRPQLVDNGGLVRLTRDYPYIDLNDTQNRPELFGRAYKGAVLWNFNMMKYFNTSRNASYVGRAYQLPARVPRSYGQISLDRFTWSQITVVLADDHLKLPPVINSTFVAPLVPIQGAGGADVANISHINADGGILLGTPIGINGSSIYRDVPGTVWTAPLYSCVSAIKVYVMDITFSINKTASLSNLIVKHASPRKYSSNATTPLWAVEETGFNVSYISPLWGIVDDRYEKAPKLWTMRKESMYIPAGQGQTLQLDFGPSTNLDAWAPGAPQEALAYVYGCAARQRPCSDGYADFSGKSSFALTLKWRELTRSAATSQKLIGLIWTDIMINLLTSSRSKLTVPSSDAITTALSMDLRSVLAPVILSNTMIRYSMLFAVPGMLFLVVYIIVVICALLLLCFGRATLKSIRFLSNQTSIGRAVIMERCHGNDNVRAMSTKEWIERHGDEQLFLSKYLDIRHKSKSKSADEQSNNEVDLTLPLVPKADQ